MLEGVGAWKLRYVNSSAKQNTLMYCSAELDKERKVYHFYALLNSFHL